MELTGAVGFNFQNWIQASQWAAQQDAYHEDAIRWADAAITANTSFQTISNKAQVLNQIGRGEEAMETLDQAIAHPTATAGLDPHGRSRPAGAGADGDRQRDLPQELRDERG